MTRVEAVQYLKRYQSAQLLYARRLSESEDANNKVKEYATRLAEAKAEPVFREPDGIGKVLSKTMVYTLPMALALSVAWFIWFIANINLVDLRHNPGAELVSENFLLGVIGLAVKDPEHFLMKQPFLSLILAALLFAVIFSFIIALTLVTRSNKKLPAENQLIQENYERRQKMIPDLDKKHYDSIIAAMAALSRKNEAQKQKEAIENQNIIPRKYLPYTNRLLGYLEDRRADSLKEAINLLEREKADEMQLDELRRHNEEMEAAYAKHAAEMEAAAQADALASERAARASERAASAAEDAAFWEESIFWHEWLFSGKE